jgi:hypothetical protein
MIKVAVYFDSDLELCNFADQVNCKTDGNTAEQSIQPPPAPLTTTLSASEAAETEQKDSDLPRWLAHVVIQIPPMISSHVNICLGCCRSKQQYFA